MPPLVAAAAIAAGGALIGGKMQSNANRRATQSQERISTTALDYERERDAELRRQWEAQEAFQRQQFAAQEEERAFVRQRAEYQDQLLREREARQAPYRRAAQGAITKLSDLLGIQVAQPSSLTAPRMSTSAASMPATNSAYRDAASRGYGSSINPPRTLGSTPEPLVLGGGPLPVSKKRSYAALLGRA